MRSGFTWSVLTTQVSWPHKIKKKQLESQNRLPSSPILPIWECHHGHRTSLHGPQHHGTGSLDCRRCWRLARARVSFGYFVCMLTALSHQSLHASIHVFVNHLHVLWGFFNQEYLRTLHDTCGNTNEKAWSIFVLPVEIFISRLKDWTTNQNRQHLMRCHGHRCPRMPSRAKTKITRDQGSKHVRQAYKVGAKAITM